MSQIWLIDFDDSFTYNIASEFLSIGIDCKVIHWREWQLPASRAPKLIVLGPGPGHPDDYAIENLVLSWWKTQIPMAGICLGHQFLARFLGLNVSRSLNPMHGESVDLSVPKLWQQKLNLPEKVSAQRYNSLSVSCHKLPQGWIGWEEGGEWIGFIHKRAISYQFHPESVGTSCPAYFFRAMAQLAL
jgi:anthranilate/para-aminobenzoate synthase component II